jgi:hypothetical protein
MVFAQRTPATSSDSDWQIGDLNLSENRKIGLALFAQLKTLKLIKKTSGL